MKKIVLRFYFLIRKGEIKFLINGVLKRMLSKTKSFGLKRDLNIVFSVPDAQIDISIRPYKEADKNYFAADLQNDGLIEKYIPTCYVATTTDGIPCHRQWFMKSQYNEQIQEFWGESFPKLCEDEALIESVFTIPAYRGNGIMPVVLDQVAEKAKDLGVRYVMLFVNIDNIPSLKGSYRSGFLPYVLRTEKWVLFKRTVTFKDVPKESMHDFFKDVNKSANR